MSDSRHAAAYAAKLVSATDAAALIPSGAKVTTGLGFTQPPAILVALADRARAGEVEGISLYYMLSSANAVPVLQADLQDRLRAVSLFHGGPDRALDTALIARGLPPIDVIPSAFSRVPHALCHDVGVDVLVTTVAPMDEDGCFNLGINIEYTLAAAMHAKMVILEVNPAMPRVRGNCRIPMDRVTAVVENAVPLLETVAATPRPEDITIAKLVAERIRDGACLQMGIGAIPEVVCSMLGDRKHLGIHTELLTPGLVDLMRCGAVDNSRKANHNGRTIYTFAMGDRRFYDYLNDNPLIEGHPVENVNDPSVIAANDQVVSVNATIEIDLQGACNSEVLNGRQYSGSGGQLDFVRGASASKGGMSVIVCHSTAAGGKVSRIVPKLAESVTTPRTDIQWVATEFGMVNLRGLSVRARARALIALAHPDFRAPLERSAAEFFG